MPKFAANLSTLFGEVGFLDRFEAAAKAGFRAVECQFPYDWPAAEVAARLKAFDLELVLHNLPPGDFAAGERGIACLPGREVEFREGLDRAITYAKALACPRLNCLAGIAPAGADKRALRETLVANLRHGARALADVGIELLVEPINGYDMPDFFVQRSADAVALFDEVGHENVHLQYDVYHMQRMEGDLGSTLKRLLPRIGHVQIADNPGRHEPGTGEINFDYVFRRLEALGYDGWIGCEYTPKTTTLEGLDWMNRVRIGAR
ncbi:MAG: hydroxypyruvate isomerase [Hyphomicrobiales bacterium]|nr:hydroxypyruvate isomerase [Hyphomicrobiales bacterium]MDE2017499.1 hydroxypyruvate isomerase [Hyphomicrobiales bacterium]